MKEIWKRIKGFDNYAVSNKGRVKNIDTWYILKSWKQNPKSQLLYIKLQNGGKSSSPKAIHTLVASHFDKMQIGDDTAIHLNFVQFDNREPNLEGTTRGKAIVRTRKHNRLKAGKIKGIYKWPYFSIKENKTIHKWRAVLSLEDGKMGTKTLGYFKTKKEAKEVFHKAYTEKFGYEPFKLV